MAASSRNPVHNALDQSFAEARTDGRSLLIPYVTAGYPVGADFVELVLTIFDAGAGAIEIGIPFSDPLLDGPAIQRSQQAALRSGVTPAFCLESAFSISRRTTKPLIFMGAFNPIFRYGVTQFCRDAAEAGVTALIVPDLPQEEQVELLTATDTSGLHLIQMLSPTSSPRRIETACHNASGFVYCLSVSGVTGVREALGASARPLVEEVKKMTRVPVAVGFGVSNPEQAREVATFADGVIVGSALTNLLAGPAGDPAEHVGRFISALAGAMGGERGVASPEHSPPRTHHDAR